MTESNDTPKYRCPNCDHEYSSHVEVEGVQGCCPRCYAKVRDKVLKPDQSKLGGFK